MGFYKDVLWFNWVFLCLIGLYKDFMMFNEVL